MKNKKVQKYITGILSNTTEINEVERTVRTFSDDKGNEFCTIFYNEDMLMDYMEIYTDTETITVADEDIQEVLDNILERQKEL